MCNLDVIISLDISKKDNYWLIRFAIVHRTCFIHLTNQFWHFPVLKDSDDFRFWHFPVLKYSDIFRFWHLMVRRILISSGFEGFWHFQILTSSGFEGFWHFQILTSSVSDVFRFWNVQRSPAHPDIFLRSSSIRERINRCLNPNFSLLYTALKNFRISWSLFKR